MLLGQKITERVAQMRTLPAGIDQRSACRHPDWTGPDDLTIKIQELRELTDWEKPVFVKNRLGSAALRCPARSQAPGPTSSCWTGCRAAPAPPRTSFIEHAGITDTTGLAPGGRSAPGVGAAPESAADHLRRHPQRRRCCQGHWRWERMQSRWAPLR